MERLEIFDTIETLRSQGRPFCLATVVRTADVTSAKAGAKAVIGDDGAILGHLGGACVQGAVRAAAVLALETGATRMIRVKPSEDVTEIQDTDGADVFQSGCPSGGTVDILIEPYPLAPRLAVMGDTAIARAVRAHGELMGLQGAEVSPARLRELSLSESDFIVIAAQGMGDGDCLSAALETPVRHIAMVASARKAAVLSARMIERGHSRESVDRLKSPAGLRIGGIDPHEVAISILAEIVRERSAARLAGGQEKGGSADQTILSE